MSGIIDDQLNETLRLEFVEGYEDNAGVRVYPTLDALIKRHDVPKNTVYRRAKDQGWQEQRNQWQATYQAKVNKDRATKAAKDADAMDSASINIAKASLSVVMRRVNATFRAERGDEGSSAADIVSVTELRDLVETGLKAQKMGKLALAVVTADRRQRSKLPGALFPLALPLNAVLFQGQRQRRQRRAHLLF